MTTTTTPVVSRVLVTNSVCLNGGDAAIALATVEELKRTFGSDVEVTFADNHPDVAARLYPDLRFQPQLQRYVRRGGGGYLAALRRTVHLWRFLLSARQEALSRVLLSGGERALLDRYRRFDLVLSSGGTILTEAYAIWPRLAELRVVQALGTPVALFTQSLGPFTTASNRRDVARVGRRATTILLRDGRSREHLAELGVAGDVCEDVVFALPAPPLDPEEGTGERAGVVVSVRAWRHVAGGTRGTQRYLEAVAAAVTSFVRDGHAVEFVSTCQGVPEYSTDDSAVARSVVALLDPDVAAQVQIDEGFHRPEALQSKLARAELAVCTRMHMAILALTVGTPVAAIAYEFKTTELFGRLGRPEQVVDIDNIDDASLLAAIGAAKAGGPIDIGDAINSATQAGRLIRSSLWRRRAEQWRNAA